MMDLTFLIPTRIETADRLRNIISTVSYLLKNVSAKVIVKEVSEYPNFHLKALPEIKKYVDTHNLTSLYEESNEPLFCKSRVLNDLIVASNTKIVANYDADCILPLSSYHNAYEMINMGDYDVVYPYQCGIYQWSVKYDFDTYEQFVGSLDISFFDNYKSLSNSTIGWTQFIDRQKYIDSYMMNENFISWGCEDDEFYYRMSILGNRIGRVDDYVYHLEHSRTRNSWFSNPNFNANYKLWSRIKTFDKDSLMRYYENQDYIKKRRSQMI